PHACRLVRIGTPARRKRTPPVPTGLTVVPAERTVGLTWNRADGATGYTVTRFTDSDPGKGTILATNLRGSRYVDRSVKNGTRYRYTVRATNNDGTSLAAPAIVAMPHPPASPLVLGIDFAGHEWAMDPSENAGVVRAAGWNSAYGSSGTLRLRDSAGA